MRGGKREGAGRPKGNEPTKLVAFRIPISKIPEIKEVVKNKIAEYKINLNLYKNESI